MLLWLALPAISLLWAADFLSVTVLGHFLHGGTAYMWNQEIPLLVRLLSLYHLFWPALLLFTLRDMGYHPSAFKLQSAIAAIAMIIGLLLAPKNENLNYVFHWPNGMTLFYTAWWHAPISFALLIFLVYLPTHWLLKESFARRNRH